MSESPKKVGAARVELKDLLLQMPVPCAKKGGQRSDTLKLRVIGKTSPGVKTAAVGNKSGKPKPKPRKQKATREIDANGLAGKKKPKRDLCLRLSAPFSMHCRNIPRASYIKASDGFVCSLSHKRNNGYNEWMKMALEHMRGGTITTKRVALKFCHDVSKPDVGLPTD